ncbi:MAG TPA: DUF177 domain-containing protein [Sphingomonas sp.]|nr:DUF177 domain-containing protein [Sphingomonas sp.]
MTGTASEFARSVRLDTLGPEPRAIDIAADEGERAALARRFGLIAIDRLEARARVSRDGAAVRAEGRILADAMQSCVATGDPVPAHVDEPFALRFEPEAAAPEEVELGEGDLDVLPYSGGAVDLGEAAAQGFALALDPFPRSPRAEERLRAAGVRTEEEAEAERREASPFAVLKQLKK